MNGLDTFQLAAIPQELKEAVCNAVVNLTVARVSGSGHEGEVLYGTSPRRSIVSGQLLPRFDPTGQDDETSDIRIAALGIDLQLNADAQGQASMIPRFSVYVRVLPDWVELKDEAFELEIDFKLRQPVQDAIDVRIRQLRNEQFAAANVATPNWPSLNPVQRQQVRSRRAEIQEDVRRQAYREQGIILKQGDEQFVSTALPVMDGDEGASTQVAAIENVSNSTTIPPEPISDDDAARLRIGRLLQNGRTVPFGLLDSAPLPSKWRRLDLIFPPLVWPLQADRPALDTLVADYSLAMRQAALQQVTDWINSRSGIREVWRDIRVQPQDTASEQAWAAFRARVEQIPPSLPNVLPSLGGLSVQIERTLDFIDPSRAAIRVMLDNRTPELPRRDAITRSDTCPSSDKYGLFAA